MIKNYLLLLVLCLYSSINAQIVNIPDANFKAKLLESDVINSISMNDDGTSQKIDKNGDGEIQKSEALLISSLDIRNSKISSLEGIQSFSNLFFLECSDNQIATLDLTSLPNLQTISCDRNDLTNLNVQKLSKLQTISCWTNKLTGLNLEGLSSLQNLQCGENMITSLNIDQCPDLVNLGVYKNRISILDLSSFSKLENLFCGYNELINLDLRSSTNIKLLACDNNKLTSLLLPDSDKLEQLVYDHNFLSNVNISHLSGLLELSCSSNKITKLDLKGHVKLKNLFCPNNEITNLDLSEVPDLIDLNCFGNLLTEINLSPLSKLVSLIVYENKLTEINVTKFKDLEYFYCYDNQLTNIDLSGLENISYFYCGKNKLDKIDIGDLKKMESFHFEDNPLLESVFLKNGSVETDLLFSNNPKLKYICVDEDQLLNVQSLATQYGYTDCSINSYCSFTPGGESFTIQGNNKNDIDNNGCDVSDIPASFFKFKIDDGIKSGNFISNETGSYSIKVPAGSYTITPVFENTDYFSVSPPSLQVEFPTVTSPFTQNFCIIPQGIHNDLETTILPFEPARPGFVAKYKIVYKNKGNTAQSGTVNLFFNNAALNLISVTTAVSLQTQNNISWNFSNLKPFETREIVLSFDVNSPIETPAINNGDILKYIATINSSESDENPIDNVFNFNQTVVGSYDPNDKTCLEGNVIKPELIGEYVHYMIRFENTGNYIAENIVVKDIIDLSKFDISTLVPTSSSHSYTTKISDGNKVEFIFEKINLPFDDANNDGYIAFKIKTLPTLAVGDTFTNEANIYFDYNFPILTNKATSTFKILGTQDFEFSNYFNVYPNPAKATLNISSKNKIEIQSMSIYDILGQLVIAVPNADNVSSIDVSKLRTGNYLLKIKTEKGISGTKFIKE
jgi:Leucine-rich repeat (LRR) protein